jgi:hypothetical protein
MAEERDRKRQSRLRAALRENLKRRKQQLRGRADSGAPPDDDRAAVPDKDDRTRTGDRDHRE